VPANKKDDREARLSRDRLRGYRARQQLNEHQQGRRARDNWIAAIVTAVVLIAAVAAQIFYFNGGPGTPVPEETAAASESASTGENVGDVPDPSLAEARTWTGTLTLNETPLAITLDGALAPQAVASFVTLAQSGYFDDVSCHRLTTGDGFKVLQCGDPTGDGTGGPGYSFGPIENAPADDVYGEGVIAMARQGGNAYSMGSQFFIVYGETTIPSDDAGGYTVFGSVTSGLDLLKANITDAGTADGSADGAPAVPTLISSVTVQ
jgi:peptidyl-prolyl cis-trans isomerase B (cyclophilin B)